MGLIFVVIMFAIIGAIASAVNALAVHWAAALAEAEYPDYKETFITIFWGYMVFFLVMTVLTVVKMHNGLFMILIWLGIIGWVMYTLVNKLGIEGNKNIVIFVGMSFFFNVMISFVISLFMPR